LTQSVFPAYNLIEVLGLTRGTIACSLCGRKIVPPEGMSLEKVLCQRCSYPNTFIRMEWQGEEVRIYNDKSGRAHKYATALKDLMDINAQIGNKIFDPREWETASIQEKLFDSQVDVWLERKEKEEREDKFAPSTLRAYRIYGRSYFKKVKGLKGVDVREIRLKHLQMFYDNLPGGLSPKYRKNIMDALHSFMKWLTRWGEIKEVPTWPEIEDVITRQRFALTYDEQQEALSRIPIAHRDVIEFSMETGLRPGELCALMVIDIDMKRRRALIRRTYSDGELKPRTKQRRENWVALSDRAFELARNNISEDCEFVFKNSTTGRGYRTEFIRRVWVRHSGTNVELYEATRHSFCTQIVEDGASGFEAQQLMRHADGRSTNRYYHPTTERQRDLVNRRGRKVIDIREGKK
jgi:integrase